MFTQSSIVFAQEEAQTTEPIQLTDAFTDFHWEGNDAMARETFSLQLDKAAQIQITDFKNRGDMFEIYDNDVLLGKTSEVDASQDDQVYAATPEEALNDERYSKGTFALGQGEHRIAIKAKSPYEAGTAAIRLIQEQDQNVLKKSKKKGWDDDDDDDDDKKGDWEHDRKKGSWDDDDGKGDWDEDDKKDPWDGHDDDKKGGWGDDDNKDPWEGHDDDKKGGWDDDKKDPWGDDDRRGGWGDDDYKKDGWKGDWDDDYKKGDWKGDWDDDFKKGDWEHSGFEHGGLVDLSHTITVTKTHWIVEHPSKYTDQFTNRKSG